MCCKGDENQTETRGKDLTTFSVFTILMSKQKVNAHGISFSVEA
jgi:hypothetical protein